MQKGQNCPHSEKAVMIQTYGKRESESGVLTTVLHSPTPLLQLHLTTVRLTFMWLLHNADDVRSVHHQQLLQGLLENRECMWTTDSRRAESVCEQQRLLENRECMWTTETPGEHRVYVNHTGYVMMFSWIHFFYWSNPRGSTSQQSNLLSMQ